MLLLRRRLRVLFLVPKQLRLWPRWRCQRLRRHMRRGRRERRMRVACLLGRPLRSCRRCQGGWFWHLRRLHFEKVAHLLVLLRLLRLLQLLQLL